MNLWIFYKREVMTRMRYRLSMLLSTSILWRLGPMLFWCERKLSVRNNETDFFFCLQESVLYVKIIFYTYQSTALFWIEKECFEEEIVADFCFSLNGVVCHNGSSYRMSWTDLSAELKRKVTHVFLKEILTQYGSDCSLTHLTNSRTSRNAAVEIERQNKSSSSSPSQGKTRTRLFIGRHMDVWYNFVPINKHYPSEFNSLLPRTHDTYTF